MSKESLNIVVSGLYSGPSPSAGLGIAHALRAAWPKAKIIGMDYFEGSSGIQSPVFDQVILCPSWDILDEEIHKKDLLAQLQSSYFISALDIETNWVAKNLGHHRNLLLPSYSALQSVQKAANLSLAPMGIKTPDIINDSYSDEEVYDFLRRHSFRAWVKGKFHGAYFARSWKEFSQARDNLRKSNKPSDITLQAHVRGNEESVCFCAHQGQLLEAIYMKKMVMTEGGKTWAGEVHALAEELRAPLVEIIRQLEWTGGGEIEVLRDANNQMWLVELNPRFPAWIDGARIAGFNLPAQLVSAASGQLFANEVPVSNQFTRIVREVAVQPEFPLPPVRLPGHGEFVITGKYGAGFEKLANTADEPRDEDAEKATKRDDEFTGILNEDMRIPEHTPARALLTNYTQGRFEQAAALSAKFKGPDFRIAYSFKTSPYKEYLELAKANGMRAEAISMAEVEKALKYGWAPEEIILNGPAKFWPRDIHANQGLRALFVDSVEELEQLIASGRKDRLWGIRVRLPGFPSRFGVNLADPLTFRKLYDAVRRIPKDVKFGFHFHLGSSLIGTGRWKDALASTVLVASNLSVGAGKPLSLIDFGGGYHPRDLFHLNWESIHSYVRAALPDVKEIVIEPGRALTQDTMCVTTRILEVREADKEVVVDACIAELPLINVYPHRFYIKTATGFERCDAGAYKVFGRICMEEDILSPGLELPAGVQAGDCLVIADAGAYERSMSYEFGNAAD